MTNVTKRDGEVVDFGLVEIMEVVKRAFKAADRDYSNEILELLFLRITTDFQSEMQNGKIPVEQIQDSVEHVLEQVGYTDVVKAYILYGKQREKIRNMKNIILDYRDVANSYAKIEDWRVKEDFTVTYSASGPILNNSGAMTANYWFFKVYDNEIAEAHRDADIRIRDLFMLIDYYAGWSLKRLLQEGLGGIPDKITSSLAKHLSVFYDRMINFLGIIQNEWAGVQTFSSFNIYLALFIKADNLSYPEAKKYIKAFIYGVNTPSHWGTQAPFFNTALGWTVPNDMAELDAVVGGKKMDFKYKDCKREMDMINKAFIKTMIEDGSNRHGFQYPIPTYSITRDFGWSDTENSRLLLEITAKYGTPYFSSYISSDMGPNDMRSMCYRLRLNLRELCKKTGGFFGSNESIGSVGVVTINMSRIAYLSEDAEDFYRHLDHMMDISARSLKTRREAIIRLLDNGLYPCTKRCLESFENHLSIIDLISMNEVGLNAEWLGSDLTHEGTQEFIKDMLNHMRERSSDYQEMCGDLYSLEATSAESTIYRLAKHGRKRYPDIITTGHEEDTPCYANSSHLSADYTADVFDALDVQGELQALYTSRTVFRVFLGEKLPDWQAAVKLVHTIAENYELPYYTLPPTYSICKDHDCLIGEHFICPICGQEAKIYSRIIGYYRPVEDWNGGKSQEYKNRTTYGVTPSVLKKGVAATACMAEVSGEEKEIVPVGICLLTTKTCPSYRMTRGFLKDMDYQMVDAEENPELAGKLGITQVPALVPVKDGEIQKYVNTSNIKKSTETR